MGPTSQSSCSLCCSLSVHLVSNNGCRSLPQPRQVCIEFKLEEGHLLERAGLRQVHYKEETPASFNVSQEGVSKTNVSVCPFH